MLQCNRALKIIFENYPVQDPSLELCCLQRSLSIKSVFFEFACDVEVSLFYDVRCG